MVYTDATKPKKSSFSRLLGNDTTPREGTLQALLKSENVKSLRPLMNEMRLTKSEAEISNMRKAGKSSGRAFTEIMGKQYHLEKDLWNDLAYGFKTRGLDGDAYVPVVAGGTVSISSVPSLDHTLTS